MPTIHRQDGFKIRVYPKDHPPAHVHCRRGKAVVVVFLPTDGRRPMLREQNRHAKFDDVTDALRIVGENSDSLWNAWRQCHG